MSVSNDKMIPSRLQVRDGDQVVLSITGDRSETVTLQGYQQQLTLINGVPVAVTFIAARAGTFDFVAQGSGKTLGQLEVTG